MKPVHVPAALVLASLAASAAQAQPQTASTPPGIRVKAGDTVFIDGPDKVKIIRRQHADIRTIHNPAERWLALIVDYKADPGKSGDSQADINYTFQGIADWPLGERWAGSAVIDEYFFAGNGLSAGIGLLTSGGFLQVLNSLADASVFQDSAALTFFSKGFGRGGGGPITMEVAEQQTIAQAQRNAERIRTNVRAGGAAASSNVEFGVVGGGTGSGGVVVTSGSSGGSMGLTPVRVGSNIRTPQKIHHVDAVRPKTAEDAGIFGMVVLEIVIATDGRVLEAKALRSIPALDRAAIDAVKQWRYEVTHLNGEPVPVVMTVTVNFR
jgi:TonB family protein